MWEMITCLKKIHVAQSKNIFSLLCLCCYILQKLARLGNSKREKNPCADVLNSLLFISINLQTYDQFGAIKNLIIIIYSTPLKRP